MCYIDDVKKRYQFNLFDDDYAKVCDFITEIKRNKKLFRSEPRKTIFDIFSAELVYF